MQAVIDAAFKVFDKNGSGSIDFRELCYSLSLASLSGREQGLQFLFGMFDTAGKGFISTPQARTLLQACYKSLQQFGRTPEGKTPPSSQTGAPSPADVWVASQLRALHALHASTPAADTLVAGGKPPPLDRVSLPAFKAWAKHNPAASHMLRAFDVLPAPMRQRTQVKALLGTAVFRRGEVWFLVQQQWWESWCAYVQFAESLDADLIRSELVPRWGGVPIAVPQEASLPSSAAAGRHAEGGAGGVASPITNPTTNIPLTAGVPYVHEAYAAFVGGMGRGVHGGSTNSAGDSGAAATQAGGNAHEARDGAGDGNSGDPPAPPPSAPPGPVRQLSVGYTARRPGVVDNTDLLATNSAGQHVSELRSDIVAGFDFVLLPAAVWRLFNLWYGVKGGGSAIPRRVIEVDAAPVGQHTDSLEAVPRPRSHSAAGLQLAPAPGLAAASPAAATATATELAVELYPPVLTLQLAHNDGRRDGSTTQRIMVSRATPLAALHALARQEAGFHPLPLPPDPPHLRSLVASLRHTAAERTAAGGDNPLLEVFLQDYSPCPWVDPSPVLLGSKAQRKPPATPKGSLTAHDIARLRSRLWEFRGDSWGGNTFNSSPPLDAWRRLHPPPAALLQEALMEEWQVQDGVPGTVAGASPLQDHALLGGSCTVGQAGLSSGSVLVLEVAMPPLDAKADISARAFSAAWGWFWPCAMVDGAGWLADDAPGMRPPSVRLEGTARLQQSGGLLGGGPQCGISNQEDAQTSQLAQADDAGDGTAQVLSMRGPDSPQAQLAGDDGSSGGAQAASLSSLQDSFAVLTAVDAGGAPTSSGNTADKQDSSASSPQHKPSVQMQAMGAEIGGTSPPPSSPGDPPFSPSGEPTTAAASPATWPPPQHTRHPSQLALEVCVHPPTSSWRHGRWACPWPGHPAHPSALADDQQAAPSARYTVLPEPMLPPCKVDVWMPQPDESGGGLWCCAAVIMRGARPSSKAAGTGSASAPPVAATVTLLVFGVPAPPGKPAGDGKLKVTLPMASSRMAPPGCRCLCLPGSRPRWGPLRESHPPLVAKAWQAVLQRAQALTGGGQQAAGRPWWEGVWWLRRGGRKLTSSGTGSGRQPASTKLAAAVAAGGDSSSDEEGDGDAALPMSAAHTAHHRRLARRARKRGGSSGGSRGGTSVSSGGTSATARSRAGAASAAHRSGLGGIHESGQYSVTGGSSVGGASALEGEQGGAHPPLPSMVLEEGGLAHLYDTDRWGFDPSAFLDPPGADATETPEEETQEAPARVLRSRWWVLRVGAEWAVSSDMAPAMQATGAGAAGGTLVVDDAGAAAGANEKSILWLAGEGVVLPPARAAARRASLASAAPLPRLTRGVMGLANIGNTCYMNAVVQCLSHTPLLREYLALGLFRTHLNRSSPLGTGGALTSELAAVLAASWGGRYRSRAPRALKAAVSRHKPWFAGREQHDAVEFMAALLDAVHEDTNRVTATQRTQVLAQRAQRRELEAAEEASRKAAAVAAAAAAGVEVAAQPDAVPEFQGAVLTGRAHGHTEGDSTADASKTESDENAASPSPSPAATPVAGAVRQEVVDAPNPSDSSGSGDAAGDVPPPRTPERSDPLSVTGAHGIGETGGDAATDTAAGSAGGIDAEPPVPTADDAGPEAAAPMHAAGLPRTRSSSEGRQGGLQVVHEEGSPPPDAPPDVPPAGQDGEGQSTAIVLHGRASSGALLSGTSVLGTPELRALDGALASTQRHVGNRLGRSESLSSLDLQYTPRAGTNTPPGMQLPPPAALAAAFQRLPSTASLLRQADLAQAAWLEHVALNSSVVVDLMQGQYQARTQCDSCSHASLQFQSFMYLNLPIPTHSTMPLLVGIHSLSNGWPRGAVRAHGAWRLADLTREGEAALGKLVRAAAASDAATAGSSDGAAHTEGPLTPFQAALMVRKHFTFADVAKTTGALLKGVQGGSATPSLLLAEVGSHRIVRIFHSSGHLATHLSLRDDATVPAEAEDYVPPPAQPSEGGSLSPPSILAIQRPVHWCQVAGHPPPAYPFHSPRFLRPPLQVATQGSASGHAALEGPSSARSSVAPALGEGDATAAASGIMDDTVTDDSRTSSGSSHMEPPPAVLVRAPPFPGSAADSLPGMAVGDRVDAKDKEGGWYPATVVRVWHGPHTAIAPAAAAPAAAADSAASGRQVRLQFAG